MTCHCSFIPSEVLENLAQDPNLSATSRTALRETVQIDVAMRQMREDQGALTRIAQPIAGIAMLNATTAPPSIEVFDCRNTTSLPGVRVPTTNMATDPKALRTFQRTRQAFDFFLQEFGRNSLDNAGMTLLSSIHYGNRFANAMWTGSQMVYGDGDGQRFIDLTLADDVIGHELTHGLTQHTAQFVYRGEPGGLNESMSDVFGIMFRQWRAGQDVTQSDWLIGGDVIAPPLLAQGFTCLRDMANPASTHCLSPQPTHFSQFRSSMGPHTASGIPNLAFARAARTIGGKSWEKTGKIWYEALTAGASPNLTMAGFAARTRSSAGQLFGGNSAEAAAVDAAWVSVGL